VKRVFTFGFFVAIACGQPVRAAYPSDIDFSLRLTRDTTSYHIGESIGLELSYASGSERKYLISLTNPIPELDSVTLRLAPLERALDLRALRQCLPIALSILSGGPEYLGSRPVTELADLTTWYRFQNPGHYSLTATSREVSRPKGADEGGGQENLTLESNSVEFDILPPDPSWETQELRSILRDLENAKNPVERSLVSYRLALLDTTDSARKLVELYLSTPYAEKYSYASALSQSSRIDVIIPLLETALSDPEVSPSGVPELLAQLQVRKQLGVLAAISDDQAAQQQRQTECQERRELLDDYLANANSLLLARAARHSGPQQSAAIYEAWYNAENQNAQSTQVPESLAQLRLAVLNMGKELAPDQQMQFVISEWKVLQHEQLLPLIRNLAAAHGLDAVRLWCEDWSVECSAAILSNALKPDTQIMATDVLLMSEVEHPEVDSALREQLGDSGILQDSARSQRTAALVLRAGSRKLLPAVNEALTRSVANHGYNCEVDGYLLGYLFRVALADGQRRLSEMLQDEKCGEQLFRILNMAHYSDTLVPVAVKPLDSRNLKAAAMAALFLADHGLAAVEDALWQRLDAFWLLWHDRAGELRIPVTSLERGIQSQSSQLEQSLASALSHASNWNLTPSERGRLRDGCITEQCQDIADGKMWMGL
jgi:hypothetical protein